MPQGALATVREAAAALGVSPITVLDLADAGRLAHEEIAGQTWIVRTSLAQYLTTLSKAEQ